MGGIGSSGEWQSGGKDNHIHVVQFCIRQYTHTHSHLQIHNNTKIYLPTPASPPLMDVELSNW